MRAGVAVMILLDDARTDLIVDFSEDEKVDGILRARLRVLRRARPGTTVIGARASQPGDLHVNGFMPVHPRRTPRTTRRSDRRCEHGFR